MGADKRVQPRGAINKAWRRARFKNTFDVGRDTSKQPPGLGPRPNRHAAARGEAPHRARARRIWPR